ncbi:MAG: methylated-DNA--[protein]-cysteine S-methyltransferase [Planctomycetota bacterium]|jgi:O-6-methylguanine DNA methyltransferase
MQKTIRYAVFRTKWGYFGLAGTENALLRTHLPLPEPRNLKRWLLKDLPASKYDKNLFNILQKQIIAYFEGTYVNFDRNIPIVLSEFGAFAKKILLTCRRVRFGRTISYGQLAKKTGTPAGARAVGRVMANNPLPLIIPCHRVIRSDGRIGGFSAQGGTKLKNKLLQFEQEDL